MNITAPTANQKLTLSSLNTTIITLTATHTGLCGQDPVWVASGFDFPNGNQGTSVAINKTSWPADNSFFGEKTVNCSCAGGGNDDESVRVYFDPDVVIDNKPAWFKYWQSVVAGLSSFNYQETLPSDPGYDTFGACDSQFSSYWYISVSCTLYIAKIAPDIGVATYRVDNVDHVVKHEFGHKFVDEEFARLRKAVYDTWRYAATHNPYEKGSADSDAYIIQIAATRDADFLAIDPDGDQVPIGFDLNAGGEDDENYAVYYANNAPSGVNDADWSKGGKNDN